MRRRAAGRSRLPMLLAGLSAALLVIGVGTSSLSVSSGTTVAEPGTPVVRPGDDVVPAIRSGSGSGPVEPVDLGAEGATPAPGPSLSSANLGAGQAITLLRPAERRNIDIAVADGLILTGFRTTVIVPTGVHEVQLEMAVDGASVFSAMVPGGAAEEVTVTLEIPVETDTTLSISVEERFGGSCTSNAVEPAAVRLVDNEFFFQQVDHQPETIADFFPPVLHRAIVVLDPDGASSLRSAAFELATALARRYPTMPTIDVVYRSTPGSEAVPPVSADPFTRTIVLVEADDARLRLVGGSVGPHLEIGAPAGLIEAMAGAISEQELAFIAENSVRVEDLTTGPSSTDLLGQRTLRDVGVRRLEASGSRVLELPISLPQSVFGEPVDQVRVRIGGVALASSTKDRDPVVTLWFNGDLYDSIDRDESGRFDLELVLDRSQIERDNVIVVRSELPLDCGDELPTHDLTLDAGSWVDAEPGQSLPPSLDRFPQVAVGHLSVSAGPTDDEMELAMATLGSLQGSSPLPIHPRTAPIERVLSGFSAGLVVTSGEGAVADTVAEDLTTIRSEQLAFVSAERPVDLAFVSAGLNETTQDLLVVFSPSQGLSRTFIDVVTEQGWSAMHGNSVGVRGGGEIVRSEISASAMTPAALSTLAEPPDERPSIARQFGLGALASILLVIGVTMVRSVLGALRRLR